LEIKKIIRSADWWEYKLPPLLAIGYATALKTQEPFLSLMPHLLFILFSIIIGAIYVSIINDITDIEIDQASGKKNKMANMPSYLHWLLPLLCLLAGYICTLYFLPDIQSIFLYSIPWISFSLYSFKPIRLKDRGLLGVFADASGSHIFTSLLVISSISFIAHSNVDWIWFTSTAIWALCYGIRGILWHQYLDRKNDLLTDTKTYASRLEPKRLKKMEIMIFVLELAALTFMLFVIGQVLPVLFLLIYVILALFRTILFKYKTVIILSPENRSFHILMADYYQVFFPVSLLVAASLIDASVLLVLFIHLVLFPQKPWFILNDFWRFIKFIARKAFK